MKRKFFIVSNPYAGRGKSQYALMKLKKRLDKEKLLYSAFLTPHSDNLDEFILENLFVDTTDVVVIGGDGTLNAVLNVIYDKPMVLNIIAAGTGNDFTKTLQIGTSLDEQIDTIINGVERTIDIGDCNGRKFINGVGLGFDGQIVYDNIYSKSILTGHVKYYTLVFKILGSYKKRRVRFKLDNEEQITEDILIMAVHNGTTFGGGFKLNPDAKIDDGLLSICTIGKMSGWKRFLNVGKLSLGTHGSFKVTKFYTAKRIQIEESEKTLHAHIDGEYLGVPAFDIKIIENAIKVRVKAAS